MSTQNIKEILKKEKSNMTLDEFDGLSFTELNKILDKFEF